MATKKDLIEAQGFSRRRLLSAFTSGAPGGKELEPAQPLRAVAAGVVLSAMIILGGVFYGIIRPGLPTGWENNTLVLVSDTGARYLSIEGVLYPVINTASARLLIPAGEFNVVTTDKETLSGIEIGPTIGILGAPDDLPAADSLHNEAWANCITEGAETRLTIDADAPATAVDEASVVQVGDTIYVVAGSHRHEVSTDDTDAVLRAIGLNAASAITVGDRWLGLFTEGDELGALVVPRAGDAMAGTELTIGTVVHPQGSADTNRYLLTDDGELAPLSPLAYQLYLLGTGSILGSEREVSPAEVASLPTATTPAGGVDWPQDVLTAVPSTTAPCALLGQDDLGAPTTVLATTGDTASDTASNTASNTASGVHVAAGSGALIRVGGGTNGDAGLVYLIDESGTAYPVPGADADVIERLGYSVKDVAPVPQNWVQFLPVGPELTQEAAATTPRTALTGQK